MAKKKIEKKQIIIDLKHKEIKYTNNIIKKQLDEIFKDNLSLTDYYNLDTFKIVKSLTEDKERAPKNFKPVAYNTTKQDIIDYLKTIKDTDSETYNKYMLDIEYIDFIVVNRDFNKNVIKTDEQRKILEKIHNENAIKRKEEEELKIKRRKLREENREKMKKQKAEVIPL